MNNLNRKLRVGWFSFTCCEDSSIVFTELLNKHFYEWRKYIDFVYIRMLKTRGEIKNIDVSFVEGAISSPEQEKEVKNIRTNSLKVVAVGSCAVTGMPSGARNHFTPDVLNKYSDIFKTFQYSDKVRKLADVIKVDSQLPGCPMKAEEFLTRLNIYLEEFKIKKN